ncbi:hypothetical protein [Streptomyces sp. NPDC018833]|uniref:hypothetical protein n=1 Tax=Streptomyces sp. NPDC018833 TaxID=3365053 RepID=UPI0037981AD3
MSAGGRGGRQAAMPPVGWQPPERMLEASGGTAVRVIEQSGARSRVFDFADIHDRKGRRVVIAVGLQRWLASAFAARTSNRSGVTRLGAAEGLYAVLSWLARFFAAQSPPVRGPGDVTADHVRALWTHMEGRNNATQRDHLYRLRLLWRDDDQLSDETRAALYEQPLPEVTDIVDVPAYDDAAMQRIMTAVRHDIRVARDRVRAGQGLLARFRAGRVRPEDADHQLASLLDAFDRTGDIPRTASGWPVLAVRQAGGIREIARWLCLNSHELTAFCLLLTALTAENFGTVAAWPAAHYRPDAGIEGIPGVALVESSKPRRGPEREHMVTPVEDVPEDLAALLADDDPEPRLFRSPLRVYQLLLELTQVARRHGGHDLVLAGFRATGASREGRWTRGADAKNIARWSAQHGFPTKEPTAEGIEPVEARRLRQTGIERKRRPVAHTRSTMNDHYLARSKAVVAQSRTVVADALRAQVATARERRSVPVLPASLVARAATDLDGAAREADLDPKVLQRLITGQQDTVLTGCVDHLNNPTTQPGPCAESFLACLGCENARALPHQLPLQIAALDQLNLLRAHVDPATWKARHAVHQERLEDLVGHYRASEQDKARRDLTEPQTQMIKDLMSGRMDLR